MNLSVVNKIIENILDLVTETLIDKKTHSQLPRFVSKSINNSFHQLGRFGLNKSLHNKNERPITFIKINNNISLDNLASGKCKSIFIVKSKKNPQKIIKRFTKSISNKSKNPQSYRSIIHSSSQITSRKQPNKNLQNLSQAKNFVKLQNSKQDQMKQVENQQKLRLQLFTSRLLMEEEKKINFQMTKTRQELFFKGKNKMKDLKQFTFGYDFSLLKSKSKHVQRFNQQNSIKKSWKKMIYLKTQVSNSNIKASKVHSQSTPKFSYIQTNITSQRVNKKRDIEKQMFLNQEVNRSLIDIFRSKCDIKKGIVIKEKINGNTHQLKKDTINTKSLFDLIKNQFQQSPQRSKFRSRYYRFENIKLK